MQISRVYGIHACSVAKVWICIKYDKLSVILSRALNSLVPCAVAPLSKDTPDHRSKSIQVRREPAKALNRN
jgi:hypothetical protein